MALPFGLFTSCSSPTGSPPQNIAPAANAGADQTITLPADSVTLDGGASSDSDGSITAYEWTQISKPNGAANAVLGSPAEATTTVNGLTTAGAYTFQLKVTDDDGAESTDAVVVTVNPEIATKNVTVSFPTFDLTTNPTTLSLAPNFSADGNDWGVFNSNDIVWTVTDNKGNSFSNGIIEIKANNSALYPDEYSGIWPWPPPLFTVTFYYKTVDVNNKLGEYKVFIGDYGNNKYFNRVIEDTNNTGERDVGDTLFTTGTVTIPTTPLTLTLSKDVPVTE
jgi:hypothetical protein